MITKGTFRSSITVVKSRLLGMFQAVHRRSIQAFPRYSWYEKAESPSASPVVQPKHTEMVRTQILSQLGVEADAGEGSSVTRQPKTLHSYSSKGTTDGHIKDSMAGICKRAAVRKKSLRNTVDAEGRNNVSHVRRGRRARSGFLRHMTNSRRKRRDSQPIRRVCSCPRRKAIR